MVFEASAVVVFSNESMAAEPVGLRFVPVQERVPATRGTAFPSALVIGITRD
jgi:hypothetical protein